MVSSLTPNYCPQLYSQAAKEAYVKAESPIPTDSLRKSCQTDRETPTDPLDQDKQEALEKLGLSPTSQQRLNSLISQLHFPDVGCLDGRRCTDFLIELPPELLSTNGDLSTCAKKGFPFVVWLYNQLNVEESLRFSMKHNGPPGRIQANVGPGLKSCYKGVCSASDAECSTVKKGWHLHAFSPSAHSALLYFSTHSHRAEAHFFTSSAGFIHEGSLTFLFCTTD